MREQLAQDATEKKQLCEEAVAEGVGGGERVSRGRGRDGRDGRAGWWGEKGGGRS